MRLKIVKFEDLSTRKGLKSMPWFKLQACITHDRKLHTLAPEQKWFWVCLLSFAAEENSAEIEIDLPWASHISGVPENSILQAIEHFKKNGMVLQTCDTDVTQVLHECADDVHQSRVEKRREEKKVANPTDVELATFFRERLLAYNNDLKKVHNTDPEKWADEFRKLREIDKVSVERIREVIRRLFDGSCFYATNVQAAKKFRDKFGEICGYIKIDKEIIAKQPPEKETPLARDYLRQLRAEIK